MRFYRPLNKIKALTFDLDDTLYDNTYYMRDAENALIKALNQIDGLQNLELNDFNRIKQLLLIDDPELYHDVILWRITAIRQTLINYGINDNNLLDKYTDEVMNEFVVWRHKISVPEASFKVLDYLSIKYPLAIITNGNVEYERIGLKPYFQFSFRGGEHGHSKPFTNIFQNAANKLNIPTENILHVGDSLFADVPGAINSGMQSCWLNIFGQDIYQLPEARVLPHVEIIELSELNNLL